jgi:sphingolipid delta-4 desaturase
MCRPRDDFFRSYTDEPHVTRRKQILEAHPEVATLFGSDWRPAPFAVAIVFAQLALSYYQQYWSWPVFLVVAWAFGGTASQALLLMCHELSHNLVFESPRLNDYFGIFCNIGNGFPSSTMFKRYHMEHHQFQGDIDKDTDIPTVWEGQFFTNTPLKIVFLMLQTLFYAIRPTLMRPKNLRTLDVINIVVVVVTNCLCLYFFGARSVVYLLGSSILGMGLHPCAGEGRERMCMCVCVCVCVVSPSSPPSPP